MIRPGSVTQKSRGFSMMEVLMALLIIVLGLLGLAGLQVRIQQAEFESYQRAQALVLLQDMVDRIQLNRATASCFQFTTNTTTGTPFLGVGATFTPACGASTSNNNTMANAALNEWSGLLQGASESLGGQTVGAIVNARGCVTYNSATELLDASAVPIAGTGTYTVSISWKGLSDTFAPTINCGNSATVYGAETRRRLVSHSFRIAKLD